MAEPPGPEGYTDAQGVGRWAPAATRFIAHAPTFPFSPYWRFVLQVDCKATITGGNEWKFEKSGAGIQGAL